jgi:adenylate kinase
MIIIVSGTPGTGKTSVSRRLAAEINGLHIDLSRLAIEEGLASNYDRPRDTYVINEEALLARLNEIIGSVDKHIVIDTHYPEIIPAHMVDYVFVLRLQPRILEERLRRRGWSWRKIAENVMAEIHGVVAANAIEVFGRGKVCVIDTTGLTVEDVVRGMLSVIRGVDRRLCSNNIDWLDQISPEELERYGEY